MIGKGVSKKQAKIAIKTTRYNLIGPGNEGAGEGGKQENSAGVTGWPVMMAIPGD